MCADRASTLSGSFQKVTLGPTSKILGAGKYEITGIVRKTVDCSEFGVDIDIFEFGSADGGTITLTDVAYDPSDPMQTFLLSCVENGLKLIHNSTTSGIRFWVNSTSYLTIGTSGNILMTNAGRVVADRNGMAKTDFTGKVSGAFMYLDAEQQGGFMFFDLDSMQGEWFQFFNSSIDPNTGEVIY